MVGIGLGFGGAYYWQSSLRTPMAHITAEPAPTLPPEETQADERTIILSGQNWYALQVGVYDDAANARQEAEELRCENARIAGNLSAWPTEDPAADGILGSAQPPL